MKTKTIELDGFVTFDKHIAANPSIYKCSPYTWLPFDQTPHTSSAVMVGPQKITITVPEDFDPRPAQVEKLEAEKRKLQADFAKRVTEIEREISELQCIEFTGSAA